MISLVRVDNRLIHGQVVEAWLPYLRIKRIVVGDNEAAESSLIRAAMKLAVPSSVEVRIDRLDQIPYPSFNQDAAPTLMLVRDVSDILTARRLGLEIPQLNIGNVHFRAGRRQVTPSVFLSADELGELSALAAEGSEVEIRTIPTDRSVALQEVLERFGKGA